MFVQHDATAAATRTFSIRRVDDNSVVFSGKLQDPVFDPDTTDHVQLADFSRFTQNGDFYLEIPGVGRSWKFRIAPDVFKRAYYLAMRSYYGQRCGTKVDLGTEFPGYKHDACHLVACRSAGINRHVVGNARVLQERSSEPS